jgi:outer membrane lipoprotein SlyB
MIKKLTLAAAALATVGTGLAPVAAEAQRYGSRYERQYRNGYNDNRVYRDNGYRNYRRAQKCNDGDGGTIVGALAGGLLGNQIAGRGDRTLGTIIGGVGGALAGRAIDRSDRPGYCR